MERPYWYLVPLTTLEKKEFAKCVQEAEDATEKQKDLVKRNKEKKKKEAGEEDEDEKKKKGKSKGKC